jgi:hypothetical protein
LARPGENRLGLGFAPPKVEVETGGGIGGADILPRPDPPAPMDVDVGAVGSIVSEEDD